MRLSWKDDVEEQSQERSLHSEQSRIDGAKGSI